MEFLLVSVPLLATVFATLEFGLAWYESTTLDFVTREVARNTANCGQDCDLYDDNNTWVYRDYLGLQFINRATINPDNIEYILIQHVGEQVDDPASLAGTTAGTNYGRSGPDTYANYKYHWQLYAYPHPASKFSNGDPRANTVPVRTTDPKSLGINDALPSQFPNGIAGLQMNPDGSNAAYNGWRSDSCPVLAASQVSSVVGGCRTSIPLANPDGSAKAGTPQPVWTGRYVCVPTDRFYVQITLRHVWITPFFPSVNMDGRTQSLRGFGANASILLSSKIYIKVEPLLYSQVGGGCGGS